MSSTRHAVMRGPSLTGFGNRPDLIPAHHVDLLTGIGPFGARMELSRTNPDFGRSTTSDIMPPGVVVSNAASDVAPRADMDGAAETRDKKTAKCLDSQIVFP